MGFAGIWTVPYHPGKSLLLLVRAAEPERPLRVELAGAWSRSSEPGAIKELDPAP